MTDSIKQEVLVVLRWGGGGEKASHTVIYSSQQYSISAAEHCVFFNTFTEQQTKVLKESIELSIILQCNYFLYFITGLSEFLDAFLGIRAHPLRLLFLRIGE